MAMPGTIFDRIIQEHELKNEKRVAIVRFVLSLSGILEFLSYFNILDYSQTRPVIETLIIGAGFFIYATIVLIILLRNVYINNLKFFIISFDYLYVVLAFVFDPSLSVDKSIIIWLALVAAIVFYLINLLRYSKVGTIYTAFLSLIVFWGISAYFNVLGDVGPLSIALVVILYIGYSVTISNKKMMLEANTKKMMERYLSPQLIGELYKQNVNFDPGGTNKKVTILFCDIRAFSSISESLSAEQVVTLLNSYLSMMTEIIFSHNGTIDKFIGDAILVLFGAPVENDDDGLRAIYTAIAMNKALAEFNKQNDQPNIPLQIGIGVHTGKVIAGNVGSDKRLDYTVIGDNVNLASRIEGLTKYYGCPILISESVFSELTDIDYSRFFLVREIDKVTVKGKSQSVIIYEIMPYHDETEKSRNERIIKNFELGLDLYKKQKFHDAIKYFEMVDHDKVAKIFIQRCQHFIQSPPGKKWDGSFQMQFK